MDKMSGRDERFVLEYLISLDPKKAALAAGFAPSMAATKAYQWVSDRKAKPLVYDAIQAALRKHAEKAEVTTERVIGELARIGFSDIRKAIRWRTRDEVRDTEDGETMVRIPSIELIDSDVIDDDTAAAISEVSQTAQGLKLKMYDKRSALVDLGKFTGAFKDGAEVSMPISFIIERSKR